MNVYDICERILGLTKGRPIEFLSASQMNMLERLDYKGLLQSNAQEEAVTCIRHFAHVRDSLLQQYPFVCARKSVAMSLMSDSLAGWKYTYQLPTDCLRPIQFISMLSGTPTELSRSKYEIIGRSVGADYNDLTLRYTSKMTDVNDWDYTFTTCFCFNMASEISLAVTGTPNASQLFSNQFQSAIQEGYRVGSIDEANGKVLDVNSLWTGYSMNYGAYV